MSRRTKLLAAGVLAVILYAGSGSAGSSGGLDGTVVVSGSSTVEPISIAVAERFAQEHPDVSISVDGPGTGDGFELFCDGLTHINDASSKIKPEQVEQCEEAGVDFVELQVGNDGIVALTHEDNDAVGCLTLADLYALTGPESQGVDTWDAAEPLAEELGSDTDLPELPLHVVGPGEESGTFASYVELVIEEFNEERGEEATTRPDYQSSADDNVILQGVQGSVTSLGWVGFAFADGADGVRPLPIDGGDGCVEATPDTIGDGSYPISRPLFIYVNPDAAPEGSAVDAYVDFYLHEAVSAVSDVGYVDLTPEGLEENVRTVGRTGDGSGMTDLHAPVTGYSLDDFRGSKARMRKETLMRFLLGGSALLSIVISVAIVGSLVGEAWTFVSQVEAASLWSDGWFPRRGIYDIKTIVTGSLLVTLIAMVVAVPLGLGAAIFLSEYARPGLRKVLKPALEILAGIPSVVLGFFALTWISPVIVQNINGQASQFNLAAAGIGVGILTVPLIASISEDAMRSVPLALREASVGLGARKITTTVRVVVPAALSGLVAALIVAVSRAIGETMVVFIAAGASGGALFGADVFEPGLTMTAAMASQAAGTDQVRGAGLTFQSLFFVGMLLFLITLVLNLVADRFVRRYRQVY